MLPLGLLSFEIGGRGWHDHSGSSDHLGAGFAGCDIEGFAEVPVEGRMIRHLDGQWRILHIEDG